MATHRRHLESGRYLLSIESKFPLKLMHVTGIAERLPPSALLVRENISQRSGQGRLFCHHQYLKHHGFSLIIS